MTAPVLSSQPKISETRQDAPWSGELSADLRRGSLSVNTDGLPVIDARGVCWGIVFPDKSGSYDHVPLIVEAVNNHTRLTERCEQYKGQVKAGSDEIDALKARVLELEFFVSWIETWTANPINAYSVFSLDGLFGMTRDKIAALRAKA